MDLPRGSTAVQDLGITFQLVTPFAPVKAAFLPLFILNSIDDVTQIKIAFSRLRESFKVLHHHGLKVGNSSNTGGNESVM